MGQMEASSWNIVKLVFLRKLDAEPKKGFRSFRAMALTSVMSKWYASCILLRLEKEKEPEKWKHLHMDGISCQHLQVNGDERALVSVVRPAMYLASMDTKTAFDEARPRHVAKNYGQPQYPWMDYFSPPARGRCSNAWRAISYSINVSDCGKRWPRSSWQMQRNFGQGKEWASCSTWKGNRHIRYAVSCGSRTSGSLPTP